MTSATLTSAKVNDDLLVIEPAGLDLSKVFIGHAQERVLDYSDLSEQGWEETTNWASSLGIDLAELGIQAHTPGSGSTTQCTEYKSTPGGGRETVITTDTIGD